MKIRRPIRKHPVTTVLNLGDLHGGHQTAIAHPDHMPSEARFNRYQKWLYGDVYIGAFLPDLKEWLKDIKPNYSHGISGGDNVERDYKERKAKVWSTNYNDTVPNALAVMRPWLELVDSLHCIKGNEAHAGADGEGDELLAWRIHEETGKVIPYSTNTLTHYKAEMVLSGIRVHTQHKGKNASAKNIDSTLASLRSDIVMARHRAGEPVPDVDIRFHNHWCGISSSWEKPVIVQNPSWQLPYPYIHELDIVDRPAIVGATALAFQNGEIIATKKFEYTYERRTWIPNLK